MNKKLWKIEYSQDDSKEKLIKTFNKIDKLISELDFIDRAEAVIMLDEIGCYINLKGKGKR